MIPKPFSEIVWSDILNLIEFRREEDDTIEFKQSFRGGSDFLILSDGKQRSATEAIVKEVLAFINARGGDLIIGIEESSNDDPVAERIVLIPRCAVVADRLAQSLSARIEPFQTSVSVKSIVAANNDESGVIVVRCEASLRAPHRSREMKECYVRRGREALPMPMDEIQDLTLNRAATRTEKNLALEQKFADFVLNVRRGKSVPDSRFQIRMVYYPNIYRETEITTEMLARMGRSDAIYYRQGSPTQNNVAFRWVDGPWKPMLRGKIIDRFMESDGQFGYSQKSIGRNLCLQTEFLSDHKMGQNANAVRGVYWEWILGFLANSLKGMQAVLDLSPAHMGGVVRVKLSSSGERAIEFGGNFSGDQCLLPSELFVIPDFEVEDRSSFSDLFKQLQVDICSIVGDENLEPFALDMSV